MRTVPLVLLLAACASAKSPSGPPAQTATVNREIPHDPSDPLARSAIEFIDTAFEAVESSDRTFTAVHFPGLSVLGAEQELQDCWTATPVELQCDSAAEECLRGEECALHRFDGEWRFGPQAWRTAAQREVATQLKEHYFLSWNVSANTVLSLRINGVEFETITTDGSETSFGSRAIDGLLRPGTENTISFTQKRAGRAEFRYAITVADAKWVEKAITFDPTEPLSLRVTRHASTAVAEGSPVTVAYALGSQSGSTGRSLNRETVSLSDTFALHSMENVLGEWKATGTLSSTSADIELVYTPSGPPAPMAVWLRVVRVPKEGGPVWSAAETLPVTDYIGELPVETSGARLIFRHVEGGRNARMSRHDLPPYPQRFDEFVARWQRRICTGEDIESLVWHYGLVNTLSLKNVIARTKPYVCGLTHAESTCDEQRGLCEYRVERLTDTGKRRASYMFRWDNYVFRSCEYPICGWAATKKRIAEEAKKLPKSKKAKLSSRPS
ncbi:MAG: hypothetical protein AAFX94_12715 [Myxococcota bacterium]